MKILNQQETNPMIYVPSFIRGKIYFQISYPLLGINVLDGTYSPSKK